MNAVEKFFEECLTLSPGEKLIWPKFPSKNAAISKRSSLYRKRRDYRKLDPEKADLLTFRVLEDEEVNGKYILEGEYLKPPTIEGFLKVHGDNSQEVVKVASEKLKKFSRQVELMRKDGMSEEEIQEHLKDCHLSKAEREEVWREALKEEERR